MNRFITRKKVKDAPTLEEQSPIEVTTTQQSNAVQPSATSAKRAWGRKKKQPEAKPEIDLSSALPSQDNFRTSLIMPNLSARFSMLKEQDDPKSILGKASDDSVLQPKRRSRLGEFGYPTNSLTDIAEVSSISDLPRPTLAPLRHGSYTFGDSVASDDDSIHGSIMGRARPGEGNMLFGGRQKIYRIPVGDYGAVSNLGSGEHRGMRGRALYEDDVSVSAFQKMREEEKRLEREQKLAELERDADHDKDGGADSPLFSTYNEKRETASSTTSGPSMISSSTAPTSINSYGAYSPGLTSSIRSNSPGAPFPERQRSRRLYEQGLDHHFQEQQSSALSRLHSVNKPNSASGKYTPASTPAHRGLPTPPDSETKSNPLTSRTETPNGQLSFDKLTTFDSIRGASKSPYNDTPISQSKAFTPFDEEGQNVLTQALDPSDRGKATAMGTFTKPKQFSEEQYLQRQMSLAQQRRDQQNEIATTKKNVNRKPIPPRPSAETSRPTTSRTDRSWSDSSSKNESAAFSSRTNAAASPDPSPSKKRGKPASPDTFLYEDGDSDRDVREISRERSVNQRQKETEIETAPKFPPAIERPSAPPALTHPAMRTPTTPPITTSPQSKKEKRNAWSPDALKSAVAANRPPPIMKIDQEAPQEDQPKVDSTPENDPGLRGLVREHLRHPSNQSSIYPPKSPAASELDYEFRVPSIYSTANPWETDDRRDGLGNELDYTSTVGNPYLTPADQSRDPTLQELMSRDSDSAAGGDWERELQRQHARAASSATQHEREAFANELAQRQKTIQENLKVRVGNERSPSPRDMNRNVFENTIRPFGILRTKSSRDMAASRPEIPSRSTTRNGNSSNTSSPTITSSDRSFGDNVRPLSPRDRSGPPNTVGRTLHMKLPTNNDESARFPRASEDSGRRPSGDGLRPRQNSLSRTQDRQSPLRESPPNSSRTSSSRNRSSSNTSLDAHPSQPTRQQREEFAQKLADSENRVKAFKFPSNSSSVRPSDDTNGLNSRAVGDKESGRPSTDASNSTPPLSSVSSPNFGSAPSTSNSNQQATSSQGLHKMPHSPNSAQSFPPPSIFSSLKDSSIKEKESSSFFARPRKPTIQKVEISEPTLIASTSSVDTVDLPAGASLRNGMYDDVDVVLSGSAAPAPTVPTNVGPPAPKKVGGWFGRDRRPSGPKAMGVGGFTSPKMSMERKTSMADDDRQFDGLPPAGRYRIRKISSEDGSLNNRRPRHQVVRTNSDGADVGDREGLGGMI